MVEPRTNETKDGSMTWTNQVLDNVEPYVIEFDSVINEIAGWTSYRLHQTTHAPECNYGPPRAGIVAHIGTMFG